MRNGVLTSLHDHLGALYLRAQQLWHHERPLLVASWMKPLNQ